MINLLLCGLNSYLGRAALLHLPDNEYRVFGVVRDIELLKGKVKEDINASVFSVDLIKKGEAFDCFHVGDLSLSIYFAQIPDQQDTIGIQYELLSLRNFVFLSQRDGCNRIIYVGRSYDKRYIKAVEELFLELNVDYTILLKDLAIGKGTLLDQFMDKVLKHRLIYLYSSLSTFQFRPILLKDLFSFIKNINWQNSFVRQYVEFGGDRLMDIRELIQLYIKTRGLPADYKLLLIKNKKLATWLNKVLYGIDPEVYKEYIREVSEARVADNTIWQQQFEFAYLPIEEGM